MPTYDYRCPTCGEETSVFQTIHEYVRDPVRPFCPMECPGPMERRLSVNPAMSGLANALAGDRHYENLAHSDGTLINSRTKHRQFMKERGYTVMDDFKQTWADAACERELRRQAKHEDRELKQKVTEEVMKVVAQPD